MQMPEPDQSILARRAEICADLRRLVPPASVIDSQEGRRAYDADGLSAYRQLPLAVVLPETVPHIAAVMKYCHQNGIVAVSSLASSDCSRFSGNTKLFTFTLNCFLFCPSSVS